MFRLRLIGILCLCSLLLPCPRLAGAQDAAQPTAKSPVDSHRIVLFSGKAEELAQNWEQDGHAPTWKIEDGAMVTSGSDIHTKQKFEDCQIHVEFRVPFMPDAKGQARGNSGVIIQEKYEIQILDSYGIADPGYGDCGALYDNSAPLVNACLPPLQWQTYDIIFHAPHYDPTTHQLTQPGRVTVLQNGIVVQNASEVTRPTHLAPRKKNPDGSYVADNFTEDMNGPAPLELQYHHNTVAFRNVWIVPLPEHGADHY